MTLIKTILPAVAVAGGLTAAILGLGADAASAEPAPPPPAPVQGEQPWAPPKPAEFWDGQPVVWNSGWGGRWGVWINGGFITLSSNLSPVAANTDKSVSAGMASLTAIRRPVGGPRARKRKRSRADPR